MARRECVTFETLVAYPQGNRAFVKISEIVIIIIIVPCEEIQLPSFMARTRNSFAALFETSKN